MLYIIWTASSEFGTYSLCEQRRFRRACASAQSRQNLRCSLIQAVSQEEPSERKPDPWPLWMAGHAQLKFVMTECSKTQIRLTGFILYLKSSVLKSPFHALVLWPRLLKIWTELNSQCFRYLVHHGGCSVWQPNRTGKTSKIIINYEYLYFTFKISLLWLINEKCFDSSAQS